MSDEENDALPERIWIEFAEPWGIQSWASDPDWAAAEISRGRKFRAFIDQSALTAVQRERDEAQQRAKDLLLDEHALSDAYLRLRSIIPNAYRTEHAPTSQDVWTHTEKCAKALLERAEAAEAEIEKLRIVLERIAAGNTEVFDDDLNCMVEVSADAEELSEWASAALSETDFSK